jgi:hypothetical protein
MQNLGGTSPRLVLQYVIVECQSGIGPRVTYVWKYPDPARVAVVCYPALKFANVQPHKLSLSNIKIVLCSDRGKFPIA